jgi:hypothetical protein
MRLPPETRKRLQRELDALPNPSRAESRMRADCRQSGSVKRADVRELSDHFDRMRGEPTPAEREVIRLVGADQR